MKSINSKTIVFVTGAFVSHLGWDHWKEYFESKGYTTLAPSWPHKDGTPDELRKRQPNDTDLAQVGYLDVVNHYANVIRQLPEKPILIGHSLGGLTVQKLLQMDIAAAAIAIHSVPPQGVLSFEWSFIKSLWNPLGLFSSTDKTYLMSFKDWQYSFTNGMSMEDQKAAYEISTIPESRKALRDPLSSAGKIDFKKPHPPILIISGSTDHIMPASISYSIYKRYKNGSDSIVDYKGFEGHNHYVLGLPTWKEEADYILDWIEKT